MSHMMQILSPGAASTPASAEQSQWSRGRADIRRLLLQGPGGQVQPGVLLTGESHPEAAHNLINFH